VSIAVVPNRDSMDLQGTTHRFLVVHDFGMYKMKAK